MPKIRVQPRRNKLMPIILPALHSMIEIRPGLRHSRAPHDLPHNNHDHAQHNYDRPVESSLPPREPITRHGRLDQRHRVRLPVLVAIREQERRHYGRGRVVRGRDPELEEVEHGERREECAGAPEAAFVVYTLDCQDEAEDGGAAETKGAQGDAGEGAAGMRVEFRGDGVGRGDLDVGGFARAEFAEWMLMVGLEMGSRVRGAHASSSGVQVPRSWARFTGRDMSIAPLEGMVVVESCSLFVDGKTQH